MSDKQTLKQEVPAPPDKPEPYECCGSGCSPCVYDYYYQELEKWEAQHGSLVDYLNNQNKKTQVDGDAANVD